MTSRWVYMLLLAVAGGDCDALIVHVVWCLQVLSAALQLCGRAPSTTVSDHSCTIDRLFVCCWLSLLALCHRRSSCMRCGLAQAILT